MALRTSLPVQPHLYLADTLGRPLDGGKVFFGEVNKDPELYPINIFYDSDLTIAAPQPVRSKGGFMNANGDIVEVYASEVNYSVKVLDSYGRQVFYAPDMSRANSDDSIIVEGGVTQKSINMGFSDIAAIKAISGANIGMRVYSKTLASNFIFKETSTSPVNGGTVLQGVGGVWEMEDKDAYFASWFATPNVQADQAAKLQAGYAYATNKGKPFIIDDVFWVDGRAQSCGLPNGDRCALLILTDSVMGFNRKGHIKVLTNNYSNYHVLIACNDVANYEINQPLLTGDRLSHTYVAGSTNEWGYGLTIYESSNGVITRPRINNMTGDGIYVGKAWRTLLTSNPKDITITDPVIDRVRRNGISFTSGDTVKIIRPVIDNVGDSDGIDGTFPKACIDIEPEESEVSPQSKIVNSIIDNPTLKNSFVGVYVYAFQDNLEIDLKFTGICTMDNISNQATGLFHGGASGKGKVVFEHIYLKTIPYRAGLVGWNADSNLTVEINRLTSEASSNLVYTVALRGSYLSKKLGGVTIRNMDLKSNVLIEHLKDDTFTVVGYKFLMSENCPFGARIYKDGAMSPHTGKDTYIQSRYTQIHDGYSDSTSGYANELWQNPSIDSGGATVIYLNASGDYRELKIGLDDATTTIGQGCNIQGIKVNLGAGVKTKANCKTLGGWLRFQNIEGKNTRIIDSYGVWTFS